MLRALLLSMVLATLLGATPLVAEQTATVDAVDIQVLDRDLVGIRDGAAALRERLKTRERIAWMKARGVVGAVLTGQRFLAFSTRSAGWQQEHLSAARDGDSYVALAANLALCITQRRVLAFSAGSGSILAESLSPGEAVLDSAVNEHTGVIITNRRALGYSSHSSKSSEIKLHVNEELISIRAIANSASVRTTERLLIFNTPSRSWTAEDG